MPRTEKRVCASSGEDLGRIREPALLFLAHLCFAESVRCQLPLPTVVSTRPRLLRPCYWSSEGYPTPGPRVHHPLSTRHAPTTPCHFAHLQSDTPFVCTSRSFFSAAEKDEWIVFGCVSPSIITHIEIAAYEAFWQARGPAAPIYWPKRVALSISDGAQTGLTRRAQRLATLRVPRACGVAHRQRGTETRVPLSGDDPSHSHFLPSHNRTICPVFSLFPPRLQAPTAPPTPAAASRSSQYQRAPGAPRSASSCRSPFWSHPGFCG